MSKPTLEHWLRRLEQLHPQEIELGLQRCRDVAINLELLPVACPVLTIAGTNGKGSTAAVAEASASVVSSNFSKHLSLTTFFAASTDSKSLYRFSLLESFFSS